MKVDLFDITGKVIGKTVLPDVMFKASVSPQLLAQSIRAYLGNQRQAGTARTKGRHAVRGSGRKIYKQKGTGRARHGDKKAPIFVGGGIAHGPTGRENHSMRLSKKMRRLALFGSLSAQQKDKKIIVLKGLDKVGPKTSQLIKVFDSLKLLNKKKKLTTKTLVISSGEEKKLVLAGRNIDSLTLIPVKQLNVYQVLKAGKIVFTNESLPIMQELYKKEAKK